MVFVERAPARVSAMQRRRRQRKETTGGWRRGKQTIVVCARGYAKMLAAREEAGPFLARAVASRRMKLAASELQRPPTSRARTTRRAREAPTNSGYVLSLAGQARCKAAPRCVPQRGAGLLPQRREINQGGVDS